LDFKNFFELFGGSARQKNLPRRPYAIPDKSGLPPEFIRLCPWEMEYLFAVARRARHGILETGRFNGGSCFLMACAAETVPIYSIDIKPKDDAKLKELFEQHGVGGKVQLIVGDSQHQKYPQIEPVDMVFIDGDHRYQGCLDDLRNWYDLLRPNGHLVLHDCYLGKHGVQDAVADFMGEHPELQVVQSPIMGASYWTNPAGSIGHLIKR
jgi:predicted O-methyltransferase YrrM